MSTQRSLAPHVQAAIVRAAQPRLAGAVGSGRPIAPHVQRAVARPIQAKPAGLATGGRPLAAHVERAIAGPIQAKTAGPLPSGGLQVAAHVERAIAGQATIQRRINYREGLKVRLKDPVDSLMSFQDFGVTPVIVNTLEIPPSSNAARILTAPTLNVDVRDEQTSVSIRDVATQNVSYRMELPTSPPWTRRAVAKNHLKSALEMQLGRDSRVQVPITDEESGTIDLEIKGAPDDDTFADLVERHEKYHARELEETIQEILQPWDTMLQRFQEAGTRWSAANRDDAEAALYGTVGGTPKEVGERFVNALRDKGLAFHATATGSSPSITDVQKSYLGGTLRVYMRHPVELERWHARELRREGEERARQRAMDEATRRFDARRAVGDVTINSSSEGNRYILNDML